MNTQQADNQYIAGTYGRFNACMKEGSGALVTDEDGKQYIDMGSGIGVNVFGVCDPEWVEAVEKQLHTLSHVSNLYYTQPQVRLAQLLCEKSGMSRVFFGNSGAEANEGAIKIARKYGNDRSDGRRNVIVTLVNSFHGRTIATLKATGQDRFHQHFGPFPEGFRYVPANDIEAMRAALEPGDVCGVMMEMIQGEGGVHVLDKAFVQETERLCREKDALVMVDEVQTGMGRTGTFYAFQQFDIQPDLVTSAKGLGAGLPIGAVLMSERCRDVLGKGDHGSTFGGNPICTAGACSVVERLDEDLLRSVREKGEKLRAMLLALPQVKAVDGLGLMLGVTTDKPCGQVATRCLEKGLMVLTAKEKIRLLPPLTITMEQLEAGVGILAEVLAE